MSDRIKNFRPGAKILIVDDLPDIRLVLEVFLKYEGAEVLIAENSSNAIDIVFASQPALVLLDMFLPDHDGYFTARTMRQRGFEAPIIAMTGRTGAGEREKCIQAGCADYLTKPIDLFQLRAMLHRHLALPHFLSDGLRLSLQ